MRSTRAHSPQVGGLNLNPNPIPTPYPNPSPSLALTLALSLSLILTLTFTQAKSLTQAPTLPLTRWEILVTRSFENDRVQAARRLQRAFRSQRLWAAEMAKLRAVLIFERAAITGSFFGRGRSLILTLTLSLSLSITLTRTRTRTRTRTLTRTVTRIRS